MFTWVHIKGQKKNCKWIKIHLSTRDTKQKPKIKLKEVSNKKAKLKLLQDYIYCRKKKKANEKLLHRYEQNKSDCSYNILMALVTLHIIYVYSCQYDLYMILCTFSYSVFFFFFLCISFFPFLFPRTLLIHDEEWS